MIISKVVGNLWTTQKEVGMENLKLLIVQPVDKKREPIGNVFVAVDRIGAGSNELVLVTTGSSARSLLKSKNVPIDAVIVGIVDSFEVND